MSRCIWVGTSLGGICGIVLAAQPGTPITRMVINDIGPFIPRRRLGADSGLHAAAARNSPTSDALEAHLRVVHAPFGVPDDAGWAEMAQPFVAERCRTASRDAAL